VDWPVGQLIVIGQPPAGDTSCSGLKTHIIPAHSCQAYS